MISAVEKKRTVIALIIYLYIFISTIVTIYIEYVYGAGGGQLGEDMIGLGIFKAFTMDSNILCGIAALVLSVYTIRTLKENKDSTPHWAALLQFTATASIFLTFVTVACFLGPSDVLEGKSYFTMFSDDMFIFHFVNPLLAIFAFVYLQRSCTFKHSDCIFAMIPTIIYAAVYIMMVVVLKSWEDFYGFTLGGKSIMVIIAPIVIMLLIYLLARLLLHWNTEARAKAALKKVII